MGLIFNDEAFILFADITFGLIEAIDGITLVINSGLGRIDILGDILLLAQGSASKSNNLSGKVHDGKHHASTETVMATMLVRNT